MNHIRDKLPDMKARLNTLMGQAQQELNSFGDSAIFGDKNQVRSISCSPIDLITYPQQQGSVILRLMTQFARDFISSIDGTKVNISTKELSGGARIYYIFNDVFGTALASIDATHNLENQDIRTAIRNSTGPRPSLFVPEIAFDLLVKPQIKLLEAPSLRCVELVYEELVKICHNCTSTVSWVLSFFLHPFSWGFFLGTTTLPSITRTADRSRVRAPARAARPHVRVCTEPDRDTSRIHQHEPPRIHH